MPMMVPEIFIKLRYLGCFLAMEHGSYKTAFDAGADTATIFAECLYV